MMIQDSTYGRILFILRHAKSSWEESTIPDKDRPLAPRGWAATEVMATYMARHHSYPDGVFCSTARRTTETWNGLEKAWGGLNKKQQISMMDRLYLASAATALAVIRGCDDCHHSLLVIGHNPGWGDLALGLSGGGDREDLKSLSQKFPTAALAVIGFDLSSWSGVTWGSGYLCDYQTPRGLMTDFK